MLLGLHVETKRGYDLTVDYAERLGCTALQIFSSNPKTYRVIPPDVPALERFRDGDSIVVDADRGLVLVESAES